jgi:hypothetical protein
MLPESESTPVSPIVGMGVILLTDVRGVDGMASQLSPATLVNHLTSLTEASLSIIENKGGATHMHVGGNFVAYWLLEHRPSAPGEAFAAARAIVGGSGAETVAASIAIGEFGFVDIETRLGLRSSLVGAAYNTAWETLKRCAPGSVGIDSHSLDRMPVDIKAQFKESAGIFEFRS